MKFFFALILVAFSNPSLAITAQGHQIMISAPSRYGAEIGKEIAKKGGNAVDVAVAVGIALSVTTPYYAALGGGGFALVRMGDSPIQALDFRETAPAKTSPTFYTEDKSRSSMQGGAAVGVPGNPAGLYELHKKYGKLAWKTVVTPAVLLAQNGFEVSGEWVEKTEGHRKYFSPAGIKTFYKREGKSYLPGEVLKQPALAKALSLYRNLGPKGFYQGAVAKDVVDSVKNSGGVLDLKDMASYKVRWLEPLKTTYNGYEVYLMPPPSSGGVVIAHALKLVEGVKLNENAFLSVDELHLLGEIQARAYRGRSLLGDPDFHKNPIDQLLGDAYVKDHVKSISKEKTKAMDTLKDDVFSKESSETTHFTVMDAKGNAVTLTYTLNGNYGSGVVSEKYGIALNNEMDDFTTEPGAANMFGLVQGEANKVEPGKRPLSSMSPTLVLKDGKTVLALGAPGGPRIISSVFQVLYRVLGQKIDLDTAVQAPRVHHQFQPPMLFIDKDRLSPEVVTALGKKGHNVKTGWMAKVYAVERTADGLLKAAYDSRGEGATAGY